MGNHKITYILVHGAWHGSWCWKRVRAVLQSAGHKVFTPTLTGLAERSHLNSSFVDLSIHIADIVNLIKWEELSDVILCGHSYAGCVITGAANQIPERIRALVFLDAFVIENGEAFMDIVPPEIARAIRDQAKTTGEGWKSNPIPAHLLGVRDAHDAAWVDRQCTPQAIGTFEERITLTGNLEQIQDIAYLFPTERHPNLLISHERAKAKGWKIRTVGNSGHELMIDQPQEVAEFLLECVPTQ
ncbi:MAG TPA: alpha/beta fold hydrolase [Chthoniobacterales bacterium]|nr:alpha/beta fold hydrolase [Chthoniobacterales bacterium]